MQKVIKWFYFMEIMTSIKHALPTSPSCLVTHKDGSHTFSK